MKCREVANKPPNLGGWVVFGVDPSDRIANYLADAFGVLFVCGDKFDLTCHINMV